MAYVSYGVSNSLPRIGRRSVGGLGATPPVMHDVYWTMGYTRDMSAAEIAAFNQCVEAKRASKTVFPTKTVLDGCQKQVLSTVSDLQKLAALTPEQQKQLVEYAKAAAKAATTAPKGSAPTAPPQIVLTASATPDEATVTGMNRAAWWLAGAAALVVGYLVLRR